MPITDKSNLISKTKSTMKTVKLLLIAFLATAMFACGGSQESKEGDKDGCKDKDKKECTDDGKEKKDGECTSTKADREAVDLASFPQDEDGFYVIFDGQSNKGWYGYNKGHFPKAWEVAEGTLHIQGSGRGEAGAKDGGDIIFNKPFGNFELQLEWKVSEGGNSGIFYLAQEIDTLAIWQTAPEMQVLDDEKHRDRENPTHRAGALYDMIAPPEGAVKPAGEWNKVRLVVDKGLVQHFLNDVKTAEYHLWTDDWNDMVAKSKFTKYNPNWADVASEGYIGLQDHGDDVWYRNIKIKPLD